MDITIVALSSGSVPSGVAVIRLSGPRSQQICGLLCGSIPPPRKARLRGLKHPQSRLLLDEALVLSFPAPNSFTGEDVVELHCHGGRATVAVVLETVLDFDDVRLAEPGEFSRRAFENGRMDLTELEGLSDLIAAETENQRRGAVRQAGGYFRQRLDGWRDRIIRARAFLEAQFDFTDEEDVQQDENRPFWSDVRKLQAEIQAELNKGKAGEIARVGLRVALLGSPNSGKSSLLNALAQRDVAIVTDIAGTTRDVLEVSLNIDGQLVLVQDTAGIRDTLDPIEAEGIRRAYGAADEADVVFWLSAGGAEPAQPLSERVKLVHTKADLRGLSVGVKPLTISCRTPDGVRPILNELSRLCSSLGDEFENTLITRERHRTELEACGSELNAALTESLDVELRTDHLRRAGDAIGRLTGRIETDDLLDVIFSEFCVGK
ncbi:MAG: tRNA uridine-5-carboxymethylaminomethyl(34) synthesis GTPase MnmE [Pseudomonadota bacterium]